MRLNKTQTSLIMKMILKVELFASVETKEVSAADLKRELQFRITENLKGKFFPYVDRGDLSYKTFDGRTLEATVKWLTEGEAFDSLK